MKRLVQIANLPQVTICFQQQKGVKSQIKALSDYNKSLDHYKTLVKQLKVRTVNYCQDILDVLLFKKKKATKRSVIDYYTIMIENLMEFFVEQAKKVVNTLDTAYLQSKQFYKKADKMVIDSKKMIDEQIVYHEKIFKQYMVNVYPQTSSIFFRLKGADKKFTKRQDPSKEAALIQQYKAYQQILNCQISKINETIHSMTNIFKQKTQDFKSQVVSWLQACLPQFQSEMRQDEIKSFADRLQPQNRREREHERQESPEQAKDDLDY